MPSRRPSKRRRKSPRLWSPPSDWTPWLWAVLAANLLAGFLFSPLTALSTVRVVGAQAHDQKRIEAIFQHYKSTPYARIDSWRLKTQALEGQEIEDVRFRANLFGRGLLELDYKLPVAKVAGMESTYLSSRGSVFKSRATYEGLVVVEPPYVLDSRNLAVLGSWRSGDAAKMCENIGGRLPDKDWRLVVSRAGFVDLHCEEKGYVEFGSFEEADFKVQVLEKILKDDPRQLGKVKKIVLTSPSKPVRALN